MRLVVWTPINLAGRSSSLVSAFWRSAEARLSLDQDHYLEILLRKLGALSGATAPAQGLGGQGLHRRP